MGAPNSPIADDAFPAERRNLTYAGTCTERGNLIGLLADVSARESEPQGEPTGLWARDGGRSECLPVMGRIGVESFDFDREQEQMATSLHAKAGRLPIQVARHEKVWRTTLKREGK